MEPLGLYPMPRRATAPLLQLPRDAPASAPLHRQVYDTLRQAVLSGNLAPGARLPSSRGLAEELGCARNTVLAAYEQLQAEGYLESRHGSGSFVSLELPDDLGPPQPARGRRATRTRRTPMLSGRGRALLATQPDALRAEHGLGRAFAIGEPDLEGFPFADWARLLARSWRAPHPSLHRRDPAGHGPLREAIATHLNAVRGLQCTAGEVIITSGAQQGIDLVARLLCEAGEGAWIEDPGYPGLRGPLQATGLETVPVPVDEQGMDVDAALAETKGMRLAVVTPSHQYPLGATLALERRLALLDWAHASNGWVLEDDYDSEFRYAGRPLASLRGLDADRGPGRERVIYLGSFSKATFAGLRIGYLVVPRLLADDFARARRTLDDHGSIVAQPALAEFMTSGAFAAHVRRMRKRYATRQARLLAHAKRLSPWLDLAPDEGGMHLVAGRRRGAPRDTAMRRAAAAAGVETRALSDYYLGRATRGGLLLGYAAVPEADIDTGVRRLADALSELRSA